MTFVRNRVGGAGMIFAATVLLLSLAIAAVMELQVRSNASRDSRLHVSELTATLNSLQNLPWQGDPRAGGSPTRTLASMRSMEAQVDEELAGLRGGWSPRQLDQVAPLLRANFTTLDALLRAVTAKGSNGKRANDLGYQAIGSQKRLDTLLAQANAAYSQRANEAATESLAGSAIVIAALVAAFMLLYRRERTRVRERAEQETLRRREAELRTLVAELEAAQRDRERLLARTVEIAEHERIRVAQDLHDGPIQQLTAVALRIDLFIRHLERDASNELQGTADGIREQVAEVMGALRGLMVQLRPPILDERGLIAALHDEADRILGDTVGHTVSPSMDEPLELEPEVETVIYRIAHEALTNIWKHAHANHVDVSLSVTDDALLLRVEDDGTGFSVARTSGREADGTGYGLVGMRERIESLRGRLMIDSEPGRGTCVRAELPLQPDHFLAPARDRQPAAATA